MQVPRCAGDGCRVPGVLAWSREKVQVLCLLCLFRVTSGGEGSPEALGQEPKCRAQVHDLHFPQGWWSC